MRSIRKLGRLVLFGGFRAPRPYEAEILDATAAALDAGDQETLRRQIALIERVQRWNDDRMVIIGFEDKGAVPKLRNEATDHCLAKLRAESANGSVTASVMTHRGILSSLEFRPSPRSLPEGDLVVRLLETHASDSPVSRLVDAEEHEQAPAR
jgi:hypothetical protein